MPMKTDGKGKRWVEMEVILPGTPEQVWEAMATGPGLAAWFINGEIEPRAGGAIRFDFGGGAATTGEVTAWQPPHQLSYVERDWLPGAPPVATEITITARSGDRCVMRMVHSLFTSSAEWDDQVEGFEKGWPGFFVILSSYLAHFAGQKAATFSVMKPANEDALSVWLRLCDTLGLSGANVGERRSASSGPDEWSGVVEHVYQDAQQRYVLLRIDAPSPGLALVGTLAAAVQIGDIEIKLGDGPTTTISVNRYFYGDDAGELAAESESRWRDWLTKSFETQNAAAATTG